MNAVSFDIQSGGDCETHSLKIDLLEARGLIVQLQRELERARNVIEQQRDVVQRATRLLRQGKGS
jgi:hypothetical protein